MVQMRVLLINQDKELQDAVQKSWFRTYLNPKYKYCHANYAEVLTFDENTWVNEYWVILNDNDDIVGYVEGNINRITYNYSINLAVNFTDDKSTMGRGLAAIFGSIIHRNFHKIEWMMAKGNPIAKSYKRVLEELEGRIEGIKEDNVRLWDNEYTDAYMYAVMTSSIPPAVKAKYLRFYHRIFGSEA